MPEIQRNSWLFASLLWGFSTHFVTPQKGNQKKGFLSIPPKLGLKVDGKYSKSEFAGNANPNIDNAEYDLEKETGVLTVDNGATTTLSNTLFNMSNVQQYSVKISLAGREMSIKATHGGYKSSSIKDITGTIPPQMHNQSMLCTGTPKTFISWKGTFKCGLLSNS